ncbi:MAG: translocation/assembly module TamB domain-containing protein, partial [Bacteroidota bacterium]
IGGNFTLKELPKALAAFAKYTFTEDYVDTSASSPQDFTVDLRIYEPGNLTRIIHPKFKLIRNSHIEGSFNSIDHQVSLKADIPELKFANYSAYRIDLNTQFKRGDVDFRTEVDKIYNGDSLLLDTVGVLAKTLDNKDVRFDVSMADKRKFNYANLTAFLTPLKGKALVRLDPSDVKLGNNYWQFEKNNFIFIEGKKIITQNLVFRTQDEAIFISSYLKNDTSTSLRFTLDNTTISDFTGMFATKMKDLHGAINGKLVVEDIFYRPNIYADLVVDEFKLGAELIGDVNVDMRLDEAGKNVNVYASVKSVNNFIEAKGNISLEGKAPTVKIDIDAPRLGLNFLNYKFFTEKYVKNCRGYAEVHATIAGPLSKPLLTGKVLLVDDTVTISFLNTTYHVDRQEVILDEHGFSFPNLKIYDDRNNPLQATGRINHESFKKFSLDLKVRTENAQFINTTAKQSPNFYGVAYGAGSVTFSGDISSPIIRAFAVTKPGTYIRLPINSSYETNRYGFYKFVNDKEPQPAVALAPQLKLNGVNFILEVEATPDARMDIILDPVAGDILTTYGSGNLKLEIPRVGNMTIYGAFEIDRGSYLFTLQNILNKRFEINRGGNINFNGEVSKARVNINAEYLVRSSVSDLIADVAPTSIVEAARSRVTIKLLLGLTGVLEKPNINFNFVAVDVDPLIRSYLEQKLAILKTNENELNKQVFGLLVMNRFLPSAASANDMFGNTGATAANTVSEFVSSQLSNYLGNLLDYTGNDALQNLDINVGFRQYDQTNTTSATQPTLDTRRELQLALQQRLLNNRLTISAGGNFDFGNSGLDSAGTGAGRGVIPTGDFQIQYALTPDARWRAKAFNRTNYDYFNSRNNNRTGVGISYSREFDKPIELFQTDKAVVERRKKAKAEKQEIKRKAKEATTAK